MKFWTVLGVLLSTRLLAQDMSSGQTAPATNAPPAAAIETPAPAPALTTNAPAPAKAPAAKKPAAKKTAKKPSPSELRTVPLVPGTAVVVANRVNVRGQAGLKGEVISRMTNSEPVTVVEEITLKRSGPEEPSAWAKILLPPKVHAWVHASFIDATNKTVLPKQLNMRGGPGENFSILGRLRRGDVVKEIETKGNWMQIEAPTNAFAFMAAQYLSQEPAALAAAGLSAPTLAATTPATVTEPPPIAASPSDVTAPPATDTNDMAAATTPETEPAVEEPPPPRIVQHEGIVRYTASIQAPTIFQLVSAENRKPINYLYTTSTNLNLNRYKGLHVIITGEEGLDERWKSTPIITIHRIQVIE
jgi:uncharacterized protein YgiM (DUF1202 family)